MRNKNLLEKIIVVLFLLGMSLMPANAYDTYISPELYHSYEKQQIKTTDQNGNTVLITPNYKNAEDRNKHVSEKIVVIYDKHSPAYGYQYVLYTPIGKYVGHRRILQPSLNGYGYEPIPDGGEFSETPCFKTIQEAKHYYYPQWY